MNPEKRRRRAKLKAKQNRLVKSNVSLFFYKDGQPKYTVTKKAIRDFGL